MRTKLCPVGAEQPRAADDPGALAGGGFGVQLGATVGGGGIRPVGLHVRVALPAVEDVVARVRDERRTESCGVQRAADVHGRRPLRLRLRAVDVRPGGGVQDELDRADTLRRRQRHVPVRVTRRHHLVGGERGHERAAELPAGARDQDAAAVASRSERIGLSVLHR